MRNATAHRIQALKDRVIAHLWTFATGDTHPFLISSNFSSPFTNFNASSSFSASSSSASDVAAATILLFSTLSPFPSHSNNIAPKNMTSIKTDQFDQFQQRQQQLSALSFEEWAEIANSGSIHYFFVEKLNQQQNML